MTVRKSALGRGLDSLFGDIETKVSVVEKQDDRIEIASGGERVETADNADKSGILYVDIDEIKPNSMQPRQTFDRVALDELAESIKAYGVIQPVLLQKGKNGYELVAGERRWRAARKAGLKTIPAIVRKVTSEENALIALIENMQREDINIVEEAMAYKNIIRKYGMTQENLAKVVGKSRPHIANALRLLGLPPEIVDMLRTGALTMGHANALGAVKDANKQIKLTEEIVKKGLSVREAERLAVAQNERKQTKSKKTVAGKTDAIRIIEQELTSSVGIRVVINGSEEKGSVDLHYFDRTGLEEIIGLIREISKKQA